MEILTQCENRTSLMQCSVWSWWRWILVGGISALAWAPIYMWIVLLGTWSLLIMGIYYAPNWKQAAKIGWWWSFGWHFCTVFWIGNSLWVADPWRFAWFWPGALVGIPAVFALYLGVAMALLRWGKDWLWSSAWSFGMMWCVLYSFFEFLKGVLFTGFPWNLVAYIWGNMLCIAQGASLVSSYGLGLVTLFLLSWPARLWLKSSTWQSLVKGLVYTGLGLASIATYSSIRLKKFPTQYLDGPVIRVVQPNFTQKEKQDKRQTEHNWNTLLRLSEAPGKRQVTHIIWPETAFPFYIPEHGLTKLQPLIHQGTPIHFITGALMRSEKESSNSIVYISPDQHNSRALYHKQFLVPFGEYLPLKNILKLFLPLRWLQWLSPFSRDIRPSNITAGVHHIPDLPPSIMRVCYEIVFPITYPRPKADWILNVTNDAWFGYSPGPFQHLVSSRFRAIEEGLPLVRAANTGISVVFDGLGRLCGHVPLEKRGYLDLLLPKPVPVSYRFVHEWIYFGALLIGLIASIGHSYVYGRGKRVSLPQR